MKSYIEYAKDMNEEMKTMEALKGNQDHPCVGIFNYDDEKKELIEVEKKKFTSKKLFENNKFGKVIYDKIEKKFKVYTKHYIAHKELILDEFDL